MHWPRRACDSSITFPQLVPRVAECQTLTPFFAHVVGKRPDEQIVIEGPAGCFRRWRATPAKPLIQTNHFVHDAHRHHNGEEWQGRDCDICDRYGALQQRLRTKPKDFAEAFGLIRDRPVTHSDTMNQMALRPADGKALVRVRN